MRDANPNSNTLQATEKERAEYLLNMCTGIVALAKGMGKRGEMISYLASMMVLELEAVMAGAESPMAAPVRQADVQAQDKALAALFHYMSEELD
ncbi:MAG: hypothetical protein AAF903_10985 [Pseudomonadota bacterium]